MKQTLLDTLSKYGKKTDYMEIRFEDRVSNSIFIRDTEIETVKRSFDFGGCIRVLHNGTWLFSSFNKLEDLDEMADSITKRALIVPKGDSGIAEVPVVVDEVQLKDDAEIAAEVPLEEKIKILTHYNGLILNYKKNITNSAVAYMDSFIHRYFANSEGSYIYQPISDMGFNISAIARKDDDTQRLSVSNGGKFRFKIIYGMDDQILKCCDEVNELIDAPKVKGGKYPVVLNNRLTGVFVHESFGHTDEADGILENENLKDVLKLGRRFGKDILNIYDSGLDYGCRGYLKYDDEGVKTEKTDLIKDGILVGRLHSRETAAKLGEKPTGNARAIDYTFSPVCRMRNTAIGKGNSTFEEMIKDIKLGIYCIDALGGTGGEMFTFTAAYGIMIRDGKLAEKVKNVKLMGSLYETLENIDMVGNDFEIPDAAGGCGKAGQFPLPVSCSGPHIRIQNVTIGGE
ncbi:TldD/PmbA family protein [bacterium]|nr:TldD/PmbA family protein [bacterium]